jgi:hypothetical protein
MSDAKAVVADYIDVGHHHLFHPRHRLKHDALALLDTA